MQDPPYDPPSTIHFQTVNVELQRCYTDESLCPSLSFFVFR